MHLTNNRRDPGPPRPIGEVIGVARRVTEHRRASSSTYVHFADQEVLRFRASANMRSASFWCADVGWALDRRNRPRGMTTVSLSVVIINPFNQ